MPSEARIEVIDTLFKLAHFVRSVRASQVDFAKQAVSGLASMYPALIWSVSCSGPSWISARVRAHYRQPRTGQMGHQCSHAPQDRTSISSHPFTNLGRYRPPAPQTMNLFLTPLVVRFIRAIPKSSEAVQALGMRAGIVVAVASRPPPA
jgi:hypothetical protein